MLTLLYRSSQIIYQPIRTMQQTPTTLSSSHLLSQMICFASRRLSNAAQAWGMLLLVFAVGIALGTETAHAQSPVSEVKDSEGSTLMTIFDTGQLEATGGFLLPDGTLIDAAADLGDVSLPFSGSVSTSSPAFEINNAGGGDALRVTGAGADGLHINGANDDGVQVTSSTYGFYAASPSVDGVLVDSPGNDGIYVTGAANDGVQVQSADYGIYVGSAETDGIFVQNADSDADGIGVAGYFDGSVEVTQSLNVSGSKNFKIDHPNDPTGKYLKHAAVESSQRMNVYTGNVTLDADGQATVQLPDYFERLNTNIRYQLTAIGAPAPNLYVAQEVQNNQFRIAGGQPGLKVSWEVKGVRNDAYARSNPFQVEEEKPPAKQGIYINPEVHGAPMSQREAAVKKQEQQNPRSIEQKRSRTGTEDSRQPGQ